MTMAETLAPALLGVRRVVIACDPSANFSAAESAAICAQLVRKASPLTALPVTAATAADLDPMASRQSRDLLVLRVAVSARAIDSGRKALTLTVTPQRPSRAIAPMAAITSSASLVKVQHDWMVQGPIDAFARLLGNSGPRKLRAPVTSDRQ